MPSINLFWFRRKARSKLKPYDRRRRRHSGQATSEYMIMLMIIVSLCIAAMTRVLKPMMDRLTQQVEKNLEDRFFKEDSFHRLNL